MNINKLYEYYLNSNKISINSKNIKPNDLFFAIKGKNFNGNQFAEEAIQNGAMAAIVEEKTYENIKKNIFYVSNVIHTLQSLAKFHRQKLLQTIIIVITGSNGKTTTKELIASILKTEFNIQYTKGNLNNHIGVPLTILSIKKYHKFAIIEIGANHKNEIHHLTNLCDPDIGYITNFGKSHLKGFNGLSGVIKSKCELYNYLKNNNKIALINKNDVIQTNKSKNIQNISFGGKSKKFFFQKININNQIGLKHKNYKILSQLTGDYNFSNIAAAVRIGLYFNISLINIKNAIENYMPNHYRSQIIYHKKYQILIDAYNANPTSMQASINNFSNFKGEKCVILGDMMELGKYSKKEHQFIVTYAKKFSFNQYFFIGKEFFKIKNTIKLCNENEFYEYKDNFIQKLNKNKIYSKNLLIKGSRQMELETLLNYL